MNKKISEKLKRESIKTRKKDAPKIVKIDLSLPMLDTAINYYIFLKLLDKR